MRVAFALVRGCDNSFSLSGITENFSESRFFPVSTDFDFRNFSEMPPIRVSKEQDEAVLVSRPFLLLCVFPHVVL